MITKEDVLNEINREIKSVKERRWVNRHLPKDLQKDPKQSILDDLTRQKKTIEVKGSDYFKDCNDVHEALDLIEDEIYGENC